jgi:3-hydroxyisobutyrate dehydrogenase-like beta-hydroxyacid dehydrogenase
MPESIGFIGLGIMGQPMALNLAQAGHKLAVYNRTPGKTAALEAAGARVAASPADAVRDANVVIIIVSDSAAVESVVTGKDGILETLRSGAIVIDSSTISPAVSRKMACLAAGKGASWLDAAVTGSKHGAEKGELTYMIGGDRETFDRAMPILQCWAKSIFTAACTGLGLSAKLAQNTIQATMVEVFCEGFVLATKAGVKPESDAGDHPVQHGARRHYRLQSPVHLQGRLHSLLSPQADAQGPGTGRRSGLRAGRSHAGAGGGERGLHGRQGPGQRRTGLRGGCHLAGGARRGQGAHPLEVCRIE